MVFNHSLNNPGDVEFNLDSHNPSFRGIGKEDSASGVPTPGVPTQGVPTPGAPGSGGPSQMQRANMTGNNLFPALSPADSTAVNQG